MKAAARCFSGRRSLGITSPRSPSASPTTRSPLVAPPESGSSLEVSLSSVWRDLSPSGAPPWRCSPGGLAPVTSSPRGSSEPRRQGRRHRGCSRFHLMGCHQDGTSQKPRHRCLPRVSSVTPPRRENVVSPEGLLSGSLLGGPLKQLPREGPRLAPRSLSRPLPQGTLTPGSIPAREDHPENSGAVPVSSPGCFSWESPPRRSPPREPWRGSRGGITGAPRVVPSRRDLLEMRCPI